MIEKEVKEWREEMHHKYRIYFLVSILKLLKRKTSKKLPNIIVFSPERKTTTKLISRAKRH